MVFGHIEKLKQQYTDKYVVVDATRPELRRFEGLTGLIKTVNMNGRALVQFDGWNNIAWYDIELDFLKVVPKPEPKPAQEAVTEKAPKAATNAKGAVIGKPATTVRDEKLPGSKPGVAARPSTADILAAARAKKGEAAPATAPSDKPAAKKLSTADILAAARAKKAASEAAPPPVADAPAAIEESAPAETAEPVVSASSPSPAKASKPGGPKLATTAEKIAWCRTHDAK